MKPAILMIAAALSSTSVRAQTCAGSLDLGTLGGDFSEASEVSADGDVIVGTASLASGELRAFRWTLGGGMQDLGTLGGHAGSEARGVSADGSVVVGNVGLAPSGEGFRWTAAGGMQGFGGAFPFSVHDVSADGTVIVGRSRRVHLSNHRVAQLVEWPSLQRQLMGTLGGPTSSAEAVNADGTTVVGWAEDASGSQRAFRWTSAGGIQDLGFGPSSRATGVSADGSVVVGTALNPFGERIPVLWTASGGMQSLLPTFTGLDYTVCDVSADGAVVVGYWSSTFVNFPFRWTAASGMQNVGPILSDHSVVTGVSDDGTVAVGGSFLSLEGWRAFRLQSSILGETYCRPTVANSTGCGGVVLANGDPRLSTGSLELTATLLPQNSFGFFLTSQSQGDVLNAGGSQGTLCLGGSIGRFVGPGQVMNSGPSGSFTMSVDLNAVPAATPTGVVAVQPGETWNFQAWHRDVNPAATSNFTDAVSVTFE